ncbi:glycosyltransferase family 4 protein [Nocardioides acrostichi]|uniref:Glycosyltransferase family 4 protein n=1 Tax=Nocardioides acrostichi TaxID=2784339 RepID=A0A930Y6M5_9ACTN|nr:glycosyltransferase family 1 protein [Nocardioides acrostichi]MBF4162530.1 glycosyltransferase family 4 protein [Nocardioides acrostichi]
MRLAIDGRFLTQPLTGVQRYARELCATLDAALEAGDPVATDLEVTVLCPPLRAAAPRPAYRHLSLREVGRRQGHAWEQLDLPRHARGHDVLFCPGNVAPVASLRGRTCTVVTVHDLAFRYHPETVSRAFRTLYEVLVPQVLRHADAVLTVSQTERARMLEHFPTAADRLVAVANGGIGGPGGPPEPHDPAPPDAPYLLFVGALNARKNVAGVAATVRTLLEERPDLHAVFVGPAPEAYAAVDLGTEHPRVHVTGPVSDAALAAHYEHAALMLFPSFHEASGLPPVEAMAHGCPVVVSEIPALRERCADAAVYCDPHDLPSIAAGARHLLDDPAERERLVALGRERAAHFTWDRCLAETLAVLRRAAGGQVPEHP